jgi:hypothetical protein
VEDEASFNTALVTQRNGQGQSMSTSSQSRETTPSTVAEVVDIPPFIMLFQKERESGKVSNESRDEALKTLREWHAEFLVEEKRMRELKRKIKLYSANNGETAVTSVNDHKSRGRPSLGRGVGGGVSKVESNPKRTSGERDGEKHADQRERRASVTGPNGLTGSYWDIPTDEMGRGSRRKTKG